MSNRRGTGNWLASDRMDVTLAKAGVVVSVLLLGLRFLASQVFLVAIPLAFAAGCALYLLIRDRTAHRPATVSLPRVATGYLPSVVLLGLAGVVLAVDAAGQRTALAYVLTGGVCVVILAQVFLTEEPEPALVLFEILLAAVVVRLVAMFATPGFVGVDAWTHVPVFVEGIARTGSLDAIGGSKYAMAPFYHLVGAVGTLVAGAARRGVYLTLGLLVPLSALFVYATAQLFVPARWALFGTALYAFSDQFIRWGMHVIPTSLGLVFFLAVAYCLTAVLVEERVGWHVALLLTFSLAAVFTHQVSTAVLLVPLGAAPLAAATWDAVDGRAYPGRFSPHTKALSGVFVVTLGVTLWSWAVTPFGGGTSFLWNRIQVVQLAVQDAGFLALTSTRAPGGAAGQAAGTESVLGGLVPFIDVTGFSLLLAASVLGGLAMLRWSRPSDAALTHVATAAVVFVVVFGLSLFGIRALLPGRWIAFMYVPFAVMAAAGLYHLSRKASRPTVLAVALVLVLGYPTTMVVAEKATLDSPAFEETYPRYAYTEPEIAAMYAIATIRPPAVAEGIRTDHPYRTIFESPGGFDARVLVMSGGTAQASTAVVYRDYQSTGPVTFHRPGGGPFAGFTGNFGPESVCPPGRNHVYANDQVRLCTPSSVAPGVAA